MTNEQLAQKINDFNFEQALPFSFDINDVSVTNNDVSLYEQATLLQSSISTKSLEWLRFQISAKNMLLTGFKKRNIQQNNIHMVRTMFEKIGLETILQHIEYHPENIVIAQLYAQKSFACLLSQNQLETEVKNIEDAKTIKLQIDGYQTLINVLATWRSYFKIGVVDE